MVIISTTQTRCCFIPTVFLRPQGRFLFTGYLKKQNEPIGCTTAVGKGGFKRGATTLKLLLIRKCPEIKWPSIHFLIFFVKFITLWREQWILWYWLSLCQNSASDCRRQEIFWGKRISEEACRFGTQFVWKNTFWRVVEREWESSLLCALAAKNFNCDRHDSD